MSVDTTLVAQYCQDSLPSCPIPLLKRLVVEATRQFCKETSIYVFWIPTQQLVEGVADYDLIASLPGETTIADIAQAKINGCNILPYDANATVPALDQGTYGGGNYQGNVGTWGNGFSGQNFGLTYSRTNVTTITLNSPPTGVGGSSLDIRVVLMPSPDADCIPDVVYYEWLEAIENYVKWKAMTRPGEKFSDPAMGSYHMQQWLLFLGEAKYKAKAGNMTPRHRTIPNDFG